MFHKFQEFTTDFYYGKSIFGYIYCLVIVIEFVLPIYCGARIHLDGLTRFMVPLAAASLIFWVTFVAAWIISEKRHNLSQTDYEQLPVDDKRHVFRLSALLFVNLLSCGLLAVAAAFIIWNYVIDSISYRVIPGDTRKGRNRKLAKQFEKLIED